MASEKVADLWFELVAGDAVIFEDRREYDRDDLAAAYELTEAAALELWTMFRVYETCHCPLCNLHIDDCLC